MVDFPASHGWLLEGTDQLFYVCWMWGCAKHGYFHFKGSSSFEIATLNLDDGLNWHIWQKVSDIWWHKTNNWHPGPADTYQHRFPMEKHEGVFYFYFSTSVAYEDRIEAEKT